MDWEITEVSFETGQYLRGTHKLWSRLYDSGLVFVVLPIGRRPGPGVEGYDSIAAALRAEGMDRKQ
jgi:hypothetical protein